MHRRLDRKTIVTTLDAAGITDDIRGAATSAGTRGEAAATGMTAGQGAIAEGGGPRGGHSRHGDH